ncbi:MAG: protease pro-enzyme activation domain-containing protein [Acidimicrobiales bacterium]
MKTLLRAPQSWAVLSISALAAVSLSLVSAPAAGASPSGLGSASPPGPGSASQSGPGSASPSGPNAYVPVPTGLSVSSLPGAVAFGTTPPGTPETVSFVLKEQDISQLEGSVERGVSSYLSVSQFAQTYGQSQYNITRLQDYLNQFGITTEVYPNNIDVVASGTAGQFDSALANAGGRGPDRARQRGPAGAAVPHRPVRGRHPRALQL